MLEIVLFIILSFIYPFINAFSLLKMILNEYDAFIFELFDQNYIIFSIL